MDPVEMAQTSQNLSFIFVMINLNSDLGSTGGLQGAYMNRKQK